MWLQMKDQEAFYPHDLVTKQPKTTVLHLTWILYQSPKTIATTIVKTVFWHSDDHETLLIQTRSQKLNKK